MRPHSWKQDARHDNHERVKEVQRTVPATGFVYYQTDQEEVGEHLQRCLQTVLLPQREQQRIENGQSKPEDDSADEKTYGHWRGRKVRHGQLNGEQESQDQN